MSKHFITYEEMLAGAKNGRMYTRVGWCNGAFASYDYSMDMVLGRHPKNTRLVGHMSEEDYKSDKWYEVDPTEEMIQTLETTPDYEPITNGKMVVGDIRRK